MPELEAWQKRRNLEDNSCGRAPQADLFQPSERTWPLSSEKRTESLYRHKLEAK